MGDTVKTNIAIRCLLDKLGVDFEDHSRKSPGPARQPGRLMAGSKYSLPEILGGQRQVVARGNRQRVRNCYQYSLLGLAEGLGGL